MTTTAATTAATTPTNPVYIKRLFRDIEEFENNVKSEIIRNVYIDLNEDDISTINFMIVGEKGTPYECGFYWFKFYFPVDYPYVPMKVTFMTTDGGRVRFNPNLYKEGKVCLSLINTWGSNDWTAVNTISSVLISIQAMVMHDNPYINEPLPNHEKQKCDEYAKCVKYHNLRVACDFLHGKTGAPNKFVRIARDLHQTYDMKKRMTELCKMENSITYNISTMHHPDMTFNFDNLLKTINDVQYDVQYVV